MTNAGSKRERGVRWVTRVERFTKTLTPALSSWERERKEARRVRNGKLFLKRCTQVERFTDTLAPTLPQEK